MAFKEVASLDCDTTITLGGKDKKTGKSNPKQVEGYFLGSKETGPNKFNKDKTDLVHVFQTKDGNVGVWGKTDLNTKIKNVTPGTMVRASFSGTIPTNKGNDMLKYKVEIDETNCIDVGFLGVSEEPAESEEEYSDNEDETEATDEEETAYQASPAAVSATQAERAAKVKELLNRKTKN